MAPVKGTESERGVPQGRHDGYDVLRVIAEATAASTGQAFFDDLVRYLAEALRAKCAFVSDFSEDLRVAHVRAFWLMDRLTDPFDYDVPGTPCELVLAGEIVAFDRNVQELFPRHREELAAIGVESYLAIPLRTPSGRVCGHLAVMDAAARDWHVIDFGILRIFAVRATAELARREYECTLQATNEELSRLKDLAEAANRAKSDFLASMSHELRTPLNGVLGYAQILKRDPLLDGALHHAVSAIERCGDHLLLLIDDLLDLARIEAGTLEIRHAVLDLEDFLASVVSLARMQAAQKGLRFRYECGGTLPHEVIADERRVRQVLLNLLNNAIKFTDRGAVTLRVVCAAPSDGTIRLRFEVEDTGVGIEPGDLERIFEMFQQAGERRRRLQGVGLGLAISRRLAQAMDGTIEARSVPGMGSCFTFGLTLAAAARSSARGEKAVQWIVGYQGPRRCALVVDDVAENREVLVQLLEALDFEVMQASDGAEALLRAAQRSPDVVLMDLVMPDVDGFEAARRMREQPALSSVPILAMSASAFDQTRAESLAAGFGAFLPKPLRFGAVLDTLARVLDLDWIHEEAPPRAQRRRASRAPMDGGANPLENLLDAARRGDVLAIEGALEAIQAAECLQPELLERLRAYLATYDMKGLRAALAAVMPQSEDQQ